MAAPDHKTAHDNVDYATLQFGHVNVKRADVKTGELIPRLSTISVLLC